MVKTHILYIPWPSTRIAVPKTNSPNLYKVLHDLRLSNALYKDSQASLHDLRWSRRTLQSTYAYTICGDQNPHSEPLLAFSEIKTHTQKLNKPLTGFEVVKMYSEKLYKHLTRFTVIITRTPNFYSIPRSLRMSKRTLRISANLYMDWDG